jgi:hypothetical protein
MHICHEEILALLSIVPLVSVHVPKLRAWIHRRLRGRCKH